MVELAAALLADWKSLDDDFELNQDDNFDSIDVAANSPGSYAEIVVVVAAAEMDANDFVVDRFAEVVDRFVMCPDDVLDNSNHLI